MASAGSLALGAVLVIVGVVWLLNLNEQIADAEVTQDRIEDCRTSGFCTSAYPGMTIEQQLAHNAQVISGWKTLRYIPVTLLVTGAALAVVGVVGYVNGTRAATIATTAALAMGPAEAAVTTGTAFGCMSCHAPATTDARFCARCGQALVEVGKCPKCRHKLAGDEMFCPTCGFELVVTLPDRPT